MGLHDVAQIGLNSTYPPKTTLAVMPISNRQNMGRKQAESRGVLAGLAGEQPVGCLFSALPLRPVGL